MWAQKRKNRAMIVKAISRDELNQKIDLKHNFLLVETLSAATYHHQHLPERINLPLE